MSLTISMPVLGLSADQGSIPDMAAVLRPFGPDVRGEQIKDCGHFQPEKQPEAVAQALSRFFGALEPENKATGDAPQADAVGTDRQLR